MTDLRPRSKRAPARPQLMAILNVTPDSFSDGGQFDSTEAAIARAVELHEQGADIIDVGGESTRPGAERVPESEEQARVVPVIRALAERGIPSSVDTMNASTASAAVGAGATIINDVSGGLADPDMYRVVAKTDAHYIAMHWRGHSASMDELAVYDDVVADVRRELKARVAELIVWGVRPDRIILDPGLGFAKTAEHNWQVLAHLKELQSLGHPVLVGASRKRFLAPFAPDGAPPAERDEATAIITALAAKAGAWGVRVHDVPRTKVALDVVAAWKAGRS